MEKINISEKLRTFDKYWQSKLVGEFNNQSVKLIKLKGEFDWHRHSEEDEFLLVLKGQLSIDFQKDAVVLEEGDLFIIPCNSNHRLVAPQDVNLLIIEAKSTVNREQKPRQTGRNAES